MGRTRHYCQLTTTYYDKLKKKHNFCRIFVLGASIRAAETLKDCFLLLGRNGISGLNADRYVYC
jgi:hypothetical protein